jgi:hypothetical protein
VQNKFAEILRKLAQSNTALIPGLTDTLSAYAENKKPLFTPSVPAKPVAQAAPVKPVVKPAPAAQNTWGAATSGFQGLADRGGFSNLTQAIAARNKMQRGSADYNRVQSLINQAYGKRPAQTSAPVQPVSMAQPAPIAQAVSTGKHVAQNLLANPGMTAKPASQAAAVAQPVQMPVAAKPVMRASATPGFSAVQNIQGRAVNAFKETEADYAARQDRLKNSPWMQGKKADLTLDIDEGDLLLGGKFKNKPVVVEEFGTNELNQPTVNGRTLLTHRINKDLPEDKQRKESMLAENYRGFQNLCATIGYMQKTAVLDPRLVIALLGVGALGSLGTAGYRAWNETEPTPH